MKKLLALVLVLMLCLPAFACAENPARATALQVVEQMNELFAMYGLEHEFTIIAQEDDQSMFVSTADGKVMCSLDYSGEGSALMGFMLVSSDIMGIIEMGTIVAPMVVKYYGPHDELGSWTGAALADVLKELEAGQETSQRVMDLSNEGQLMVYGKHNNGAISVVFAVSGGNCIDLI